MIKIHYVCEQFIINQALIEMMNQGELDTDKWMENRPDGTGSGKQGPEMDK